MVDGKLILNPYLNISYQTISFNNVCEEVFHLIGELFLKSKLKAMVTPSSYCDKNVLFFLQHTGQNSRLRVEYQRLAS